MVTVPYTFGPQSGPIPLSELDANFTTLANAINTAPGATGPTGPTGPSGANGTNGTNGATGPTGATGASGSIYNTTSSSSLTLTATTQTATVGTDLAYTPNMQVIFTNQINTAQYMIGTVNSYNSSNGAMVVAFSSVTGSGSSSSWAVNINGAPGPAGATGPTGATGATGANGATGPTGWTGPSGTASAAGSNTQLQYNNSGSFAGSSLMTFNGSTLTAPISPSTAITSGAITARTMASHFADTLNVKDFGAVGDGTTDDTAALQAAINAACLTGAPLNLGSGLNKYRITSTLTAKPQVYAATTVYYPQFSDGVPFVLIGNGTAKIIAGAAMSTMLEVTYNGSTSPAATVTPYFSKIEGIYFDGNNLATTCLKTSQLTSGGGYFTITRSRFYQASVGIEWGCVGIFDINQNLFQCNTGIFMNDKGGDSLIKHNDFYFRASGDKAIYMVGYSGATEISTNTFNVETVPGTCYAIYADNTSVPANANRHIRILSNEFYGCIGFKVIGPSTSNRSIYECTVAFNHTIDSFVGGGPGILVDAQYVTNLSVVENFAGLYFGTSLASYQIKLDSCSYCNINSNTIQGTTSSAVNIISCTWTQLNNNKFINCGTAGTSEKYVVIDGGYGTQVVSNLVIQENTVDGNTFVYEQNSADGTYFTDNVCNAYITTPFYKIGFNSVNATNLFSTTSTESIVQAAGTSTNLDLQLNPKGTGKVQFGTLPVAATNPASFSPAYYMEFKTAYGVSMYIPVSYTPW